MSVTNHEEWQQLRAHKSLRSNVLLAAKWDSLPNMTRATEEDLTKLTIAYPPCIHFPWHNSLFFPDYSLVTPRIKMRGAKLPLPCTSSWLRVGWPGQFWFRIVTRVAQSSTAVDRPVCVPWHGACHINCLPHRSIFHLTHWGRVTQICVFTLQLCKTDDANLRF